MFVIGLGKCLPAPPPDTMNQCGGTYLQYQLEAEASRHFAVPGQLGLVPKNIF